MAKGIRKSTDEVEETETVEQFYQEWDCKITTKKVNGETVTEFEKLKLKRGRVLITDEQAEILNNGVLYGGNNYAIMYFKPE